MFLLFKYNYGNLKLKFKIKKEINKLYLLCLLIKNYFFGYLMFLGLNIIV